MPNAQESAELFERLRAVETSIDTHRAECGVRNQQRERWEAEIDADVNSLKIDRAKLFGYLIGAAAGGSVLANVGIEAIEKLFGQ